MQNKSQNKNRRKSRCRTQTNARGTHQKNNGHLIVKEKTRGHDAAQFLGQKTGKLRSTPAHLKACLRQRTRNRQTNQNPKNEAKICRTDVYWGGATRSQSEEPIGAASLNYARYAGYHGQTRGVVKFVHRAEKMKTIVGP